MTDLKETTVWVRGAGELGSATALILHRVGFRVFLSELPQPLAIRRTVTFSDAMFDGTATITDGSAEGETTAVRCDPAEIPTLLQQHKLPLAADSTSELLAHKSRVVVDARMLKQEVADFRSWAPLTIGLGPGFTAGKTCHAVIETARGHDLGRVIWDGPARPNTGIPGRLGGETVRRVIYAPATGRLEWRVDLGAVVAPDELLGVIDNRIEVRTPIGGLVRGLIHHDVPITKGLKLADIDPRGAAVDYRRLSDKARCVGRGVLEAILVYLNRNNLNYSPRSHREHGGRRE
jgi:xanthine dehydrogenase accessory factor